jgi:hypothetical protein
MTDYQLTAGHTSDFARRNDIPWLVCEQPRPGFKSGAGEIIDDLESYTVAGHPMKNVADPGNWVHELTHQVNSDIRNRQTVKHKKPYNAFYLLNGYAVALPEPPTTIGAIARLVNSRDRGEGYKTYLVDSRKSRFGYEGWDKQPLYIMDEMTCFANGLWYHVRTKTKDAKRLSMVAAFQAYGTALMAAVEPTKYKHKEVLRKFIQWSQDRADYLMALYEGKSFDPENYDHW